MTAIVPFFHIILSPRTYIQFLVSPRFYAPHSYHKKPTREDTWSSSLFIKKETENQREQWSAEKRKEAKNIRKINVGGFELARSSVRNAGQRWFHMLRCAAAVGPLTRSKALTSMRRSHRRTAPLTGAPRPPGH